MSSLKLATFNCNSISKHIDLVRKLLKCNDILCVQETLIVDELSGFFDGVDPRFDFCFTPALTGDHMGCGRPSGGLVIFYRQDLGGHAEPIQFEHDILGLRLTVNDRIILILNTYLPYERPDSASKDLYQERVTCIATVLDNENFDDVIILGDFNADKARGGNWNLMMSILEEYHLCQVDSVLPDNSFTYLSSHSTTSWLDHIFTNNRDLISNIKISYDVNSFDHFPLSCTVKTDIPSLTFQSQVTPDDFIKWDLFESDSVRESYSRNLDNLLNEFDISQLNCRTVKCKCKVHFQLIDECYALLVNSMKGASREFQFPRNTRPYIVPGWNDFCRSKYDIARDSFLHWKSLGMPLFGAHFDSMIYHKKVFKAALQYCKDNENELRKNALLKKFKENTKINFWKEVSKIRGSNKRKPRKVDNSHSDNDIVNLFSDKFRAIYSIGSNNSNFSTCSSPIMESESPSDFYINCEFICDTAASLKYGLGPDGIHLNHLKFASYKFFYYLKCLFNFILQHSYLPEEMLVGCIFPLVKDKHGNVSDSSNYRPITASVYLLKLFESCIYPTLKANVNLNPNQFGFRDGTSCQMAGLVLRETVLSYLNRGSRVYSAFLDMTKAYDTVCHSTLIDKISKLNIPGSIKSCLQDIYTKQSVVVRYGQAESARWRLKRGVRQGSVLSPLLFNLYVNEMLNSMVKSEMGCVIGSSRMNVIAYADDLVLISPTAPSLQLLLDKLVSLLDSLGLVLNPAKCLSLTFSKQKLKHSSLKLFIKDREIKAVTEVKYLGFIFTNNLSITADVNRAKKDFNKQFFSFFMNFKFAHFSTLAFLFKSFCFSIYGSELWCDRRGALGAMKSLAVAYHCGIKRVLKISKRSSSHWACNFLNMPTFIHLANRRLFKFFYNIFYDRSPCIHRLLNFLRYSPFAKCTNAIARDTYQIDDILDNDFQAICARIEFVQCGESIYGIDYV